MHDFNISKSITKKTEIFNFLQKFAADNFFRSRCVQVSEYRVIYLTINVSHICATLIIKHLAKAFQILLGFVKSKPVGWFLAVTKRLSHLGEVHHAVVDTLAFYRHADAVNEDGFNLILNDVHSFKNVIKRNAHRRCEHHNIRWAFVAEGSFQASTIAGVPNILQTNNFVKMNLPKRIML